MNPIEKAYRAWRATVRDEVPAIIESRPAPGVVFRRLTRMVPVSERSLGTGRRKRAISAEQRESYRRGALKMWKRRKAERRA